jgi:hypothetical protein
MSENTTPTSELSILKAFRVIVKAYHTQIVPKHTKVFDTIEKAEEYKDILGREVVWNTPVKVDVEEVYCVKEEINDSTKYYLLEGQIIKID